MKKNISVLFLFILVWFGACLASFASSTKEYKVIPLRDEKSKIEYARIIAPKDYDADAKLIWERNFENPANMEIFIRNKDKSVEFYYFSPKSYVDVSTDSENANGTQENSLRVFKRKFKTPDEVVLNILKTRNPDAKDIKLVSENKFNNDLIGYLTSQLYAQMSEMEVKAKSDSKTAKITLSHPYVQPYIAEYTYTENGKNYKQLFITMFSSVDFDYITKSSYDEYSTVVKKLWHNHGLAYIKSEESLYNDNLDYFTSFVVNSSVNKKAEDAVEQVKKQMVAEMNPRFVDSHTGSKLQNMPSELFRRYYFGGTPDYSEKTPMQIPKLSTIGWITEYVVPQTSYSYRKITNLYNQKLYFPNKYKYVYFNTVNMNIIVSETKQKAGIAKRLKPVKQKNH